VAYVKAVVAAIAVALLVAVAGTLLQARGAITPEQKQVAYSRGISEGMNNAAFFTLVLVPVALGLAYVQRRRRRGTKP
jgi:hypothetical protein